MPSMRREESRVLDEVSSRSRGSPGAKSAALPERNAPRGARAAAANAAIRQPRWIVPAGLFPLLALGWRLTKMARPRVEVYLALEACVMLGI